MQNSSIALTSPASQLAELQRRQKIAEALAAQGAEPIEVGSYKGIQAPISPFSALAKVLQTYMGAKQQADILKERKGVEQRQNQAYSALGDFLGGNPNALSGTPTARAPAPVPNQYAAMESSVNAPEPAAMPSVAQPATMAAQPVAAPSQPAPGAAIASALMAGPTAMPPVESAQTAMPTPQQAMRMDAPSLVQLINFARQNGIDPSPYIEIAKLTQPDFINVNGFVVDPHDPSNAGKYYGGLDKGQQPTLDANGNVISVSTIPGFANSSAEVTGANTAATEAAKAPYGVTEVTNIDGSKSLVRNDILYGRLGPQPAPPSAPAPGQATQPSPESNRGPTPQEQAVATAFSDAGTKLIIAAPDASREARQQSFKAQQILKGVLKLDSNAFTDIKLAAERVADALGFTSAQRTDFINNAISVKQMMGQNIIPQAKQLGSNPSNYDAQMLSKIFGNITNPKQSNALMFATIAATQEKEADRQDFYANYKGTPNSREMEEAWAKSPRSQRSIFQSPVYKTITFNGNPIVVESVVKTGPHKGEKWGFFMPYNADGSINKQAMHYKVIE